MTLINAHFDGRAVILDEPADLVVGQVVRVIVEAASVGSIGIETKPKSSIGPWQGKFHVLDERDDIVAADFKDYLP